MGSRKQAILESELSLRSSYTYGSSSPFSANEASAPGGSADLRHSGRPHFYIYRADQVRLTSMLFGGGDWHWRLADHAGIVVAECGGYRNKRDCLTAVEALRAAAWSATVSERHGTLKGGMENLEERPSFAGVSRLPPRC